MKILVVNDIIIAKEGDYTDVGNWYEVNHVRHQKNLGYIEIETNFEIDDINNYIYEDGEIKKKPIEYKSKISKRAFIDLFTDDEWGAFEDLIYSRNRTAMRFNAMLFASEFVDLEDPLIINGINEFIVPAGILTPERATEVLAPKSV